MSRVIDLYEGWLFHRGDIDFVIPPIKGPIYCQSKTERRLHGPASYDYMDLPDPFYPKGEMRYDGWESVNIPHDYVVGGTPDVNENCAMGYLHYDNAWYRRHFTLPEGCSGKRVLLRFEGVTGRSTIYLNGCLMHHNFSTYNSFEIDISDVVFHDRDNVLAVYVNTEEFEGWWYQGGGIYRDVFLVITEPVAIDRYGVYAPYEKLGDNLWQINYETTIVNASYADSDVSVISELVDADGNVVCVGEADGKVGLRDKNTLYYSAKVENPLLWDCDNPNLYTVKTSLIFGGRVIDENVTRIGFRTIEISADKGLLLNGKPTYINGVCCHQDFGLTGIAVPDNVAKYKVALLKEMGANGYRCSHYQQTSSYMDAFDEMGFIVMNESRWFESTEEGIAQLTELVKRDRNRPSVVFWSTGNEERVFVTDVGQRIHRNLCEVIRKLDKTRFITAAVDRTPDKCTIYDYCDVVGINYNLNIYDTVHELYPNKPIFASECCATGTTRAWHFDTDLGMARINDEDRDTNAWFLGREKTYRFLRQRPYVFGSYQWAGVEHRGEAAWPALCSRSGALDLFLQKKGAFYQNKSHFTSEPMAHIVTHWSHHGLEGQSVNVVVYTNCTSLELFLNGESIGRQEIEKYGRGKWNVTYTPGTLKVVGYMENEAACEDVRVTTGRAVSLKLTQVNDFEYNGKDIALFDCVCLDENGNTVPNAAETVTFSVSTPAVVVGSGSDNTDHVPVTSPVRKMYMGVIRVAVKPAKDTPFTLTAISDNCGCTFIKA